MNPLTYARRVRSPAVSQLSSLCFQRSLSSSTANGEAVTVSTLSNGVKVATVGSPQLLTSLGLFVRAGSAHETRNNAGVAHFLRRLALKSTNERPSVAYSRDIQIASSEFNAVGTRDGTLYSCQTMSENLPLMVELLSEKLVPFFRDWEVNDVRKLVEHDTQSSRSAVADDLLHAKAYRAVGLGRPLLAPTHNIASVTHTALSEFVEKHSSEPTVVGVNVEHSDFVKEVEKHFGVVGKQAVVTPSSTYKGGAHLQASSGGSRLVLAHNAANVNASALPVLAELLASTPYKGSVLSSEVVLRSYNNGTEGLLGFSVEAEEGNASKALEDLQVHLSGLKTVSAEQVAGAAADVKTKAAARAENGLAVVEAVVRGSGVEVTSNVDEVIAAATQLLASEPTLVGLGDVEGL